MVVPYVLWLPHQVLEVAGCYRLRLRGVLISRIRESAAPLRDWNDSIIKLILQYARFILLDFAFFRSGGALAGWRSASQDGSPTLLPVTTSGADRGSGFYGGKDGRLCAGVREGVSCFEFTQASIVRRLPDGVPAKCQFSSRLFLKTFQIYFLTMAAKRLMGAAAGE